MSWHDLLPSQEKWERWADEGYPARWAFWRLRDEFDGLILGVALGLAFAALVLGCALLAA